MVTRGQQNLVDSLKAELEFVEKGGYRKASWRPQFMFEDSPICINHNDPERSKPCAECILIKFVPAQSRGERFPCRHIPLNDAGETIDSLYRSGTQAELETTVAEWLKKTIRKLEIEETTREEPEKRVAGSSR